MSYQSMLVHVDDGERVVMRLGAAARLARSFDAELIGAYAISANPITPTVSAVLPDSIVAERMREMGEAQTSAEALFRAAAARARVTAAEWRAPAGEPIPALVAHARCTDLVILGQRDPEDGNGDFAADVANTVVLQSGRPVLMLPYAGSATAIGTTALVAWNGTRESARAVADAMPLLARAECVILLGIAKDDDDTATGSQPEQRVLAWLRFHGIEAIARHHRLAESDVAELIHREAGGSGADLIVMGAYSHSRLQELVLGGVTRRLLDTMTVPVLMSH
ncbi:MAG: universal stress protein [Casimicrobiaceae bacterium]